MKKLLTKLQCGNLYLAVIILPALAFLSGCQEPSTTSKAVLTSEAGLIEKAKEIIKSGLDNSDPRVRASAVEVAASARRMEFMPKIQRMMGDDYVPVRYSAALAAGDVQYKMAKNTLRQLLLKDNDENVKIAAAYSLYKLGYPENYGLLGKAITSKDQTLRANATTLLGKSGDKGSLKMLKWALTDNDSDDKVRFQAVEAMAKLGDETMYPKLWAMLISTYADDRVMGIKGMAALGTPQAKNAVISKLDDAVLEVKLAAAEQLGALGDKTGEPEVKDVFVNKMTAGLSKTDAERVNILAVLAIGQIRTQGLTQYLPALLEDESPFVRIAAAKAVFQCFMGR